MEQADKSPYTLYLEKPDRDRTDKVYKLLDFFVAGEEQNKRLLFYLCLGAYHPDLVNFIIYRGDSSAGKNFVVNAVLQLFPEDHVLRFDSATAAALNYDQALDGVKILYLRELAETNTMTEFLKNFYNEDGYIHKETIRNQSTKELMVKTHYHDRKGVITTYSFEKTQVDLVNRSWVLIPDQSYDQTVKVIDYHIDAQKNLIDREIQKMEFQQDCYFVAQSIKNLDFSYEVYIAYVDRLRALFPADYLNVRRDMNKLINLVKIITIWNQKNRRVVTIGNKKYLFAEYFDLKEALNVCQSLFINLVLHIDEVKRDVLDMMEVSELKPVYQSKKIDEYIGKPQTQSFEEVEKWYTISDVYSNLRTDMSISRKTIQRKMDELYYEGYLLRDKAKGTWRYRKVKGYDLVKTIRLDELMEVIIDDIEIKYSFYKDKTAELLKMEEEIEND